MSLKSLIGLAVVTAAVLAAALAVQSSRRAKAEESPPQQLFEGLFARLNDVERISIEKAGETLTLEKREDGWVVLEKDGYPARFEEVKKVTLGLASLDVVEAKTDDPERYAALGVGEPGAEASSVGVRLEDGSGEVLASVILGDPRSGGRNQFYARRADEARSWLVEADLHLGSLSPTFTTWVDSTILNLAAERPASATIIHPDGETVAVSRDSADAFDFRLDTPTGGRDVKNESDVTQIGKALSYLRFDDVKPVGEVDFDSDPGPTVEFRTFGGLLVRAHTTTIDDVVWARFDAEYEEPMGSLLPEPAEEEASEEASEEGEAAADELDLAADGGAAEDGAEGDEEKSSAELEAEAASIDERIGSWAFALQSYKSQWFTKRLDDLLKSAPAEEAEQEGASAGADSDEDPPQEEGATEVAAPPADEGGSE